MTAADLHAFPSERADYYEGGIDLKAPDGTHEGTLGWKSAHGSTHLVGALDDTFSGFAQMVFRLSREEWLELRHAGDEAFAAEGRYGL